MRIAGWVVVLARCGSVAACGTGDASDAEEIEVGAGLRAERTWVGPDVRIDDVVTIEDDVVVALASSGDDWGWGDVVLRSDDQGRSWRRGTGAFDPVDTPMPIGSLAVARAGAHLLTAGPTVVAVRALSTAGDSPGRIVPEVAVSDDLGAHWTDPVLPVPAGTTAIVNGAAELDGTVLLVGALQSESVPERWGSDADAFRELLDGYDAAAWVRGPGGSSFELVELPGAAGAPGLQLLWDVVVADGRFVVQGGDSRHVADEQCCFPRLAPTRTTSADGVTWTASEPIAGGFIGGLASDLQVLGQDVSLGLVDHRTVLAAGATEWVDAPLASGPGPSGTSWWMPGYADLTVGHGDLIATWNSEDNPCDCDTAFAGRIEGDQLTATRLPFEGCQLRPVGSGQSRVGRAWVLGDVAVAGFWCGDVGRAAASVAASPDSGRTWSTTRLTALAPPGADDLAFTSWTPWTKVGDAMVVLATATSDEPSDDWRDVSGPVVAIRVS